MCRKIMLLSAVLMLVGAGFMLFGHHDAEAKVCFITDSSGNCGSGTISAVDPNADACNQLGYVCSSGTTCTPSDDMISWVSDTFSVNNPGSSSYYKPVNCPLNGNYYMKCPKAFRQSCPSSVYEVSEKSCGSLRGCKCPDSYEYTSLYNGFYDPDPTNTTDNHPKKCVANGISCTDFDINGGLGGVKYGSCTCMSPYLFTSATCPADTDVDENGGDYCVSSTGEKAYKGCICDRNIYQYVAGDARCPYGVSGGPCVDSYHNEFYKVCNSCEGFYATSPNLQYVTGSTVGTPNVHECASGDDTCMFNFNITNNDPLKIIKVNNAELAYPEASENWPKVLWKDLPKYSYVGCKYNSGVNVIENKRYYIVACAEPGTRPSTTSDVKSYDSLGNPEYYHNGEACVPDGCVNVVKTILRTDAGIASKYGLFYPQGVEIPGYDAHNAAFPEGERSYFIDGDGKPIVERYVNTKSGGVLQTGFVDLLPASLSWNSANNTWNAENMPSSSSYIPINGAATSSDSLPARKTAIVLTGKDYFGYDAIMHIEQANNYKQNKNLCIRQTCYPTKGGREYYYTAPNEGNLPTNVINNTCTGNCSHSFNDIWDRLQQFIIPSAHAETDPWDTFNKRICRTRAWTDQYFWKFASSGVKLGNIQKRSGTGEENGFEGTVCGNYVNNVCVSCYQKQAYQTCTGGCRHTATSLNNCIAKESTAPNAYAEMKLQTQNDGFCVETKQDEIATYVGLKGAPADNYISIKEFYNRIAGATVSINGIYLIRVGEPQPELVLEGNRKNVYKAMLERSCSVAQNDPNPKIRYVSKSFPGNEYGAENGDDLGARSATLSMKGIDIEFADDVRIYRKFNFEDGSITANKTLIFDSLSTSDTIKNSTLHLTGVDANGYGSVLPANLVDTDVDFCGVLSFASNSDDEAWMTRLTSSGNSVIEKMDNCPANTSATVYVGRQRIVSEKYRYIVDNFILNGNRQEYSAGYSNCKGYIFKGNYEGEDSAVYDVTANDSIKLAGSVLFKNMNLMANNIYIGLPKNGRYTQGGDTFYVGTFVNMQNSILKLNYRINPDNEFKMYTYSAIGTPYNNTTAQHLDNTAPFVIDLGSNNTKYRHLEAKIKVGRTYGSVYKFNEDETCSLLSDATKTPLKIEQISAAWNSYTEYRYLSSEGTLRRAINSGDTCTADNPNNFFYSASGGQDQSGISATYYCP